MYCALCFQSTCLILFPGCPRIVRADHGTENCGVAKVQIAFRMGHNDCLSGSKSFIYGPSTANTVSNCCILEIVAY